LEDPLARLPGYSLRRAANSMIAELASRLAPLGMRVVEASVLMVIGARPNVTASQIGRILDIQRANMVPLLNRLEEAGFITRVPLNRKSQAIVLTDAGLDRLEQVNAISREFEENLMARIPEAHRDHLLPALNALWR